MRDYLGNELEIGDEVVFVLPNYREFAKGFVGNFTPQKVRIVYQHPRGGARDILQDPSQIIVVDKIGKK